MTKSTAEAERDGGRAVAGGSRADTERPALEWVDIEGVPYRRDRQRERLRAADQRRFRVKALGGQEALRLMDEQWGELYHAEQARVTTVL
jgi:hypothetical protein